MHSLNFSIGACLCIAGAAHAGIIITVDDDAGGAMFTNIQDAIDFANIGDEIVVWPGTYVAQGITDAQVIDTLGKDIFIRSKNGPSVTFIDGQNLRRVILCTPGDDLGEPVIDGFTITRGRATGGAGIYCGGGATHPTFYNCIITNCVADGYAGWYSFGAGILATDGSSPTFYGCTISNNIRAEIGGSKGSWADGGGLGGYNDSHIECNNCTITGNTADSSGGAASFWDASFAFNNCTISGNTSGSGGGVEITYGSGTCNQTTFAENTGVVGGGLVATNSRQVLSGCVFEDNEAFSGGGAYFLVCTGKNAPTISDCTFRGNEVVLDTGGYGFGGGIFCDRSSLNITGSTFEGNIAESGGGILGGGAGMPADMSLTMVGCTFSNNTAHTGGGMACDFPIASIADSVFESNAATANGGGIYRGSPGTSFAIDGCMISGNTSQLQGGGVYAASGFMVPLSNTTVCGNTPDQVYPSWVDNGGNTVTEECPPQCPDFSGDGVVDGGDLGSMLAAWGACPGCPEDLTGDGLVDGGDLGLLLAAFGPCP